MAAILCAGVPAAHACTAGSTAELAACIAGTDTVIDLTASITLGTQLPVVERSGTLTINGHGFTLDGAGQFRGFFIGSGTTTVNELVMQNLRAQGGQGGADVAPGGGGMGAGAAVFVMANAAATGAALSSKRARWRSPTTATWVRPRACCPSMAACCATPQPSRPSVPSSSDFSEATSRPAQT